jgi:hypothetical protein
MLREHLPQWVLDVVELNQVGNSISILPKMNVIQFCQRAMSLKHLPVYFGPPCKLQKVNKCNNHQFQSKYQILFF